jgi:hypothetical protein
MPALRYGGKLSKLAKSTLDGLIAFFVSARCYAPCRKIIQYDVVDSDGKLMNGEVSKMKISSRIAKNSVKISLDVYSTREVEDENFIGELDSFLEQTALENGCSSFFDGQNLRYSSWVCVATFKDHAAVWSMSYSGPSVLDGVEYKYSSSVTLEVANFYAGSNAAELLCVIKRYSPGGMEWDTLKNEDLQSKVLAFSMALHTRLGSEAAVHVISSELLNTIAAEMLWCKRDDAGFSSLLREMRS